jgi:hypothetical protein
MALPVERSPAPHSFGDRNRRWRQVERWICPGCQRENAAAHDRCDGCEELRPAGSDMANGNPTGGSSASPEATRGRGCLGSALLVGGIVLAVGVWMWVRFDCNWREGYVQGSVDPGVELCTVLDYAPVAILLAIALLGGVILVRRP